jgi:uncharacterized protein YciI
MLFALFCTDKQASLEVRLAARPAHLAYVQSFGAKVVRAGPLLDAAGKPCGSLMVLEVADRAEAEAFAAGDPYALAGLFESTLIRPWLTVFLEGERVGP